MNQQENNLIKQFEGKDIKIILNEDGEPLFELYGVGMALGYITNSKGKSYPHKTRIDKVVENAEITEITHYDNIYLNLDEIRKFITVCHSEKKYNFIKWLKENNFIDFKEVFATERKETIFFKALNKALKPIGYKVDTQVIDGDYRLDGYIKDLDMVIEYDENRHENYNRHKEDMREKYIKNKYKILIRLTDFEDLYTNIGIIINEIMKLKIYKMIKDIN